MIQLNELQSESLKLVFEASFKEDLNTYFEFISMDEIYNVLVGSEVQESFYKLFNNCIDEQEIDAIYFMCWLDKVEKEAVKLEFYEMAHNVLILKNIIHDKFESDDTPNS